MIVCVCVMVPCVHDFRNPYICLLVHLCFLIYKINPSALHISHLPSNMRLAYAFRVSIQQIIFIFIAKLNMKKIKQRRESNERYSTVWIGRLCLTDRRNYHDCCHRHQQLANKRNLFFRPIISMMKFMDSWKEIPNEHSHTHT